MLHLLRAVRVAAAGAGDASGAGPRLAAGEHSWDLHSGGAAPVDAVQGE